MGEQNAFYVGVAKCGCVRALLVDDDKTTPDEIASFAKRQKKMDRRMEHRRNMSEDEMKTAIYGCPDHTHP